VIHLISFPLVPEEFADLVASFSLDDETASGTEDVSAPTDVPTPDEQSDSDVVPTPEAEEGKEEAANSDAAPGGVDDMTPGAVIPEEDWQPSPDVVPSPEPTEDVPVMTGGVGDDLQSPAGYYGSTSDGDDATFGGYGGNGYNDGAGPLPGSVDSPTWDKNGSPTVPMIQDVAHTPSEPSNVPPSQATPRPERSPGTAPFASPVIAPAPTSQAPIRVPEIGESSGLAIGASSSSSSTASPTQDSIPATKTRAEVDALSSVASIRASLGVLLVSILTALLAC
jgi:hypothetical protein